VTCKLSWFKLKMGEGDVADIWGTYFKIYNLLFCFFGLFQTRLRTSGSINGRRLLSSHLAGWCSCNAQGLCSGGTRFEFRSGHQISRMKFFVVSPSSSTKYRYCARLGDNDFLSDPFRFMFVGHLTIPSCIATHTQHRKKTLPLSVSC
jgi:hypothetical protein